ncbi:MAG: ASPIC/UnbV domain-containing protein [Verrucomicrobiota bacterium]|jgi:tetratricopeptide (TPR) repeat protein|nr:ASPIC/UnbV domain-containing protein [Verrucomicrobiota bacterium]
MRYRQGWKALNRLLHEDRSFSGNERNCAFLNCRGTGFADISSVSGFDFPDDSRAVTAVDWDFDGDLDLWMTARTAPRLRFLRNDTAANADWVAVKLSGNGKSTNRDAVGARVQLYLENEQQPLIRTVHAGDAFLSQSTGWLHFGLGPNASIEKLLVRWPGGTQESISGIEPGKRYLVTQGVAAAKTWSPPPNRKSLSPSQPVFPDPESTARIVLSARLSPPPIYVQSGNNISELPADRLKGPLLINLWASWCAPCISELREWTAAESRIRSKGLRIHVLHADPDNTVAARRALAKLKFPFDADNTTSQTVRNLDLFQRSLLDRWLPMPVPGSFLLDRYGRVAVVYKGPVTVDQLLADIDLLDAEPNLWRDHSVPFSGQWVGPPPDIDPLGVNSQFVDHNEIAEGLNYLQRHVAVAETIPGTSPKDLADIHFVIGIILQERKQTEAALEAFEKAQAMNPKDFRIHFELGSILLNLARYEEALTRLNDARKINATDVQLKRVLAKAHFNFANSLRDDGQISEAIANYQDALRNDTKQLDAANQLSLLLATTPNEALRSPAEALALAGRLCKITQNKNPEFLDTLSIAYAANKNFEAAAVSARQALQIWEKSNNPAANATRSRLNLFTDKQ